MILWMVTVHRGIKKTSLLLKAVMERCGLQKCAAHSRFGSDVRGLLPHYAILRRDEGDVDSPSRVLSNPITGSPV